MLSITGVTDCCSPNCHSEGCPSPATAAPPAAKTAAIVTAKMVNRLSTGIVGIAPSNEALRRRRIGFHRSAPLPPLALSGTAAKVSFLGRLLGARAAEPEGNPGFSNHNSGDLAMHPRYLSVRPKAGRAGHAKGAFLTLSRPQWAVLLILDTSVRPWPKGFDSAASELAGRNAIRGTGKMGFSGPGMLLHAMRSVPAAALVALAAIVGTGERAAAQGAVKSVHNDWQVRCDTPPGAQGEQCALIQSVTAEDRANVGLTVIVLKTADQKSRLMRVVAPVGVLLPSGLGLKIDSVDVGRAGFVRCLPNGCVAEVVMDDNLVKQLRAGQTATFIIFQTPEEGIGFPMSLKGFGDGYDQLP